MKDFFKILLTVAGCMVIGAQMHKCQSPRSDMAKPPGAEVDTVTYVDTIRHYEPVATNTFHLGYKILTVPGFIKGQGVDTLTRLRADAKESDAGICVDNDSMRIELPIEQKVYEDTAYKAYVSGIYPRLDSLFVYPRREVVTIRKPPDRWSVGLSAGYAFTPKGMQPYVGIGLSYRLITF